MAFLSVGCSSLLYHPTRVQHVDPISLKINHEEIYFHSEDGVRLHGWYFKSQTKKPKGLITFFHGNAENISTHFMAMVWVIKEGYDLFIFDYRGYGKSNGDPTPKGTVFDGKAALKFAERRRLERKVKLPQIILGQSLGGAIALRSVHELKNQIPVSLIVAESTFHSYQSVARKVASRSWLLWPFQWMVYILLSDAWAPEDIIGDLSPTPILVIHGENDPVVDYELGQEVYKRAKPPKEFWQIPKGRHIDSFWREGGRHRDELIERMAQMTSKNR